MPNGWGEELRKGKRCNGSPGTLREPLGSPGLSLGVTPRILLVNSFPVLVPVNQRALLSNITAFVTFPCIHNIEALKQA